MTILLKFGLKAKKRFIQEANRRSRLKGTMGTFGKWCRSKKLDSEGKVTMRCINKGLRSGNTKIIRRANFARNIGAYKGAVHRRRSRFGSYSSEETDYKNTKQLLEDFKHMLRTDQIPQEAVLDFYEDNIEPLERKLANHTFPRTYANAIISRRQSSELAGVIADYRRRNKLLFRKRKRSPTGKRKKYTPSGGRKSPGVSATKFPIGTVKTGLDGGNWVIKKASNGTKRWVKMSSFGKRKRDNAHYKKYTPGGGRKSPGVSATKFPIGTVKTGLDGGNWVIKKASNGTKRWVKLRKTRKTRKFRKTKFGKNEHYFFKTDPLLQDAIKEVNTAEKIVDKMKATGTVNKSLKSRAMNLIKTIKQKITHIFSDENLMNLSDYVRTITTIITSLTALFTAILMLSSSYENLAHTSSTIGTISGSLGKLLSIFTKQHHKTEKDTDRFLQLKFGHLPPDEKEREIRLWKLKNQKLHLDLPSVPKPKPKPPRPPPPPPGYGNPRSFFLPPPGYGRKKHHDDHDDHDDYPFNYY